MLNLASFIYILNMWINFIYFFNEYIYNLIECKKANNFHILFLYFYFLYFIHIDI